MDGLAELSALSADDEKWLFKSTKFGTRMALPKDKSQLPERALSQGASRRAMRRRARPPASPPTGASRALTRLCARLLPPLPVPVARAQLLLPHEGERHEHENEGEDVARLIDRMLHDDVRLVALQRKAMRGGPNYKLLKPEVSMSSSAPGSRQGSADGAPAPLMSKRAGKRAANVPKPATANSDLLKAVGLGVREFSRLDSAFRAADTEAKAIEGDLEATLAAVAAGDDESAVSYVATIAVLDDLGVALSSDSEVAKIFEECARKRAEDAGEPPARVDLAATSAPTAHVMAMLRASLRFEGALRKLGFGFTAAVGLERRPRRARAAPRPTPVAVEPRGARAAAAAAAAPQRVDIDARRAGRVVERRGRRAQPPLHGREGRAGRRGRRGARAQAAQEQAAQVGVGAEPPPMKVGGASSAKRHLAGRSSSTISAPGGGEPGPGAALPGKRAAPRATALEGAVPGWEPHATPRCLVPGARTSVAELRAQLQSRRRASPRCGAPCTRTQWVAENVPTTDVLSDRARGCCRQWAVEKLERVAATLDERKKRRAVAQWRALRGGPRRRPRRALHPLPLGAQGHPHDGGLLEARVPRASAKWLGEVARQRLRERNAAAMELQRRLARGVQGRAKVRGLKKANACVRIQLACRVFLAKCKMYWKGRARRQNAAVAIQTAYRHKEQRTIAKKVVQRKREARAAVRVQCAHRRKTARRVVGAKREERDRRLAATSSSASSAGARTARACSSCATSASASAPRRRCSRPRARAARLGRASGGARSTRPSWCSAGGAACSGGGARRRVERSGGPRARSRARARQDGPAARGGAPRERERQRAACSLQRAQRCRASKAEAGRRRQARDEAIALAKLNEQKGQSAVLIQCAQRTRVARKELPRGARQGRGRAARARRIAREDAGARAIQRVGHGYNGRRARARRARRTGTSSCGATRARRRSRAGSARRATQVAAKRKEEVVRGAHGGGRARRPRGDDDPGGLARRARAAARRSGGRRSRRRPSRRTRRCGRPRRRRRRSRPSRARCRALEHGAAVKIQCAWRAKVGKRGRSRRRRARRRRRRSPRRAPTTRSARRRCSCCSARSAARDAQAPARAQGGARGAAARARGGGQAQRAGGRAHDEGARGGRRGRAARRLRGRHELEARVGGRGGRGRGGDVALAEAHRRRASRSTTPRRATSRAPR